MQEQTPDTVLEQQPAAAEPEAQAQAPAEDTQQPAEAAAPAKEEQPGRRSLPPLPLWTSASETTQNPIISIPPD